MNSHFLSSVFFCAIFIFTSACSELQITNPNPRTEIPELPGSRSLHFQLEGASAHTYRSTSDASARPPNTSKPSVEKSGALTAGLGYSPVPQFEFGVDASPFNGMGSLFAKYQLLGESFGQSEVGNFSAMIHMRGGGGYISKKGDQKGEFGPGGYPWKGSMQTTFAMGGISLGYRLLDNTLLFAGNSYGAYWVNSNIEQSAVTGDSGGTYKLSAMGRAQTFGGGVVLNFSALYLILGVDYNHIGYATDDDVYDTNYRVGLVFF